jgi:hypothetical protein
VDEPGSSYTAVSTSDASRLTPHRYCHGGAAGHRDRGCVHAGRIILLKPPSGHSKMPGVRFVVAGDGPGRANGRLCRDMGLAIFDPLRRNRSIRGGGVSASTYSPRVERLGLSILERNARGCRWSHGRGGHRNRRTRRNGLAPAGSGRWQAILGSRVTRARMKLGRAAARPLSDQRRPHGRSHHGLPVL